MILSVGAVGWGQSCGSKLAHDVMIHCSWTGTTVTIIVSQQWPTGASCKPETCRPVYRRICPQRHWTSILMKLADRHAPRWAAYAAHTCAPKRCEHLGTFSHCPYVLTCVCNQQLNGKGRQRHLTQVELGVATPVTGAGTLLGPLQSHKPMGCTLSRTGGGALGLAFIAVICMPGKTFARLPRTNQWHQQGSIKRTWMCSHGKMRWSVFVTLAKLNVHAFYHPSNFPLSPRIS